MTDPDRIQAALEQAAARREERAALMRRLDAAAPHVADLEDRVAAARARLEDESEDVRRLETFSTAKVWAQLRGSHDTDLERETAERDAARYAVAEAEARLEAMRRDVASLRSQRDQLGDVEEAYRRALAEKEAWVSRDGGAVAARLAEIAERRGTLASLDREAREAFEAGRTAELLLEQAADLLGSAGSWSTWDTFGGGGMLTDMMKYDKVDRASETLRRADHALAMFSTELADVALGPVAGVRVDQLMRTFDVWFDNIFSDMAVRSRIQDAARQVAHAREQVRYSLQVLAERGREIVVEMAALDAEREQVLLGR